MKSNLYFCIPTISQDICLIFIQQRLKVQKTSLEVVRVIIIQMQLQNQFSHIITCDCSGLGPPYNCNCKNLLTPCIAKIQVNNFQRVLFVHHFIKIFDKFITQQYCYVELLKFFDKMVNKRYFLKMIDLYIKCTGPRKSCM